MATFKPIVALGEDSGGARLQSYRRAVGMPGVTLRSCRPFRRRFLCYGIQMMPVVGGASDALLDAGWLAEAEPEMRRSCYGDEDTAAAAAAAAPPPNDMCTNEGWALLVEMASVAPPSTTAAANDGADGESSSTAVASVGAGALLQQRQEAATAALEAMPPDVFLSAGGNGHSLANCLWFVATRRL